MLGIEGRRREREGPMWMIYLVDFELDMCAGCMPKISHWKFVNPKQFSLFFANKMNIIVKAHWKWDEKKNKNTHKFEVAFQRPLTDFCIHFSFALSPSFGCCCVRCCFLFCIPHALLHIAVMLIEWLTDWLTTQPTDKYKASHNKTVEMNLFETKRTGKCIYVFVSLTLLSVRQRAMNHCMPHWNSALNAEKEKPTPKKNGNNKHKMGTERKLELKGDTREAKTKAETREKDDH